MWTAIKRCQVWSLGPLISIDFGEHNSNQTMRGGQTSNGKTHSQTFNSGCELLWSLWSTSCQVWLQYFSIAIRVGISSRLSVSWFHSKLWDRCPTRCPHLGQQSSAAVSQLFSLRWHLNRWRESPYCPGGSWNQDYAQSMPNHCRLF